jgi:hypothetical protein
VNGYGKPSADSAHGRSRRFRASDTYHGEMPDHPDDWRRMCQEATLIPGTQFAWKDYRAPRVDGDHTTSAFARGANYESVCVTCYADFAVEFHWETEKHTTT